MSEKRIALVGNPNAGKSSVFNQLTGLNQHVGNYPGVTVDKHYGSYQDADGDKVEVIDLPGTYSVFPKSGDEEVVKELLGQPDHPDFPQQIVVVVDTSNLERNLLLYTQVADMGLPVILALNMADLLEKEGLHLDEQGLSKTLGGVPVIFLNARKGEGIEELKQLIATEKAQPLSPFLETEAIQKVAQGEATSRADEVEDTKQRYRKIKSVLSEVLTRKAPEKSPRQWTQRLDGALTHPVWGYGLFLLVLFLIFQAIYTFASVPMDLIDGVFGVLSQAVATSLPEGVLTDLLAEGIIPGIGGVVIFIPQIVLLFAFIAMLEETGYMSRVVFIMDRLMRPFGLSGKSVVPLISGVACAIPAVMATRSIDQWKDRLVTIMVVPLTSCSARLPVYTLLIALVVPDAYVWGFINLQGLALLSMYLLGFASALVAAILFKVFLKAKQSSFLIMELPTYKWPRWQNIGLILWEKVKVFVWEAGKIIMALSIVLWVMASYGPPGRIQEAVAAAEAQGLTEEQVASVSLENSFIGIVGKAIEPAIEPLGYDWQIGIALITSFAAREVFVSSMATIYSVGEDFEEGSTMLERMRAEINPHTGLPVYTLATGLSLMIFYAFAMQCMSTLAIVKRETKSWKWPIIQFVYMTALAYVSAFLVYQGFS